MNEKFSGKFGVHSEQNGVSLILAIFLTALIMVVSIGATRTIISSTRSTYDMINASQAEVSVDDVVNLAVNKAKKSQLGENIKVADALDFSDLKDKYGNDVPDVEASYEVVGQGGTDPGKGKVHTAPYSWGSGGMAYILPSPWTGDVPFHGYRSNATGDGGCDPSAPPPVDANGNAVVKFEVDNTGQELKTTIPEIDHPCNWGKIAYGEQVFLPLYTIEQDGNGVQIKDQGTGDLFTKNYTSFKLRVRTPCEKLDGQGQIPEWCGNGVTDVAKRMILDCVNNLGGFVCKDSKGNALLKQNMFGDVILNWTIVGANGEMLPNVKVDGNGTYIKGGQDADSQFNESLINYGAMGSASGFNNVVLTELSNGLINGSSAKISDQLAPNKLTKPVLKLSMIDKAKFCPITNMNCDKTNIISQIGTVPYLEYQIVFDGSTQYPPINTKRLIKATAKYKGQIRIEKKLVPIFPKTIDYVIQN